MSEQQNGHRTQSPRVSVITIFLNGEAFIAQAIESVIAQTYRDWEYLLVDDGSGATATAIAKEYAARYPRKIRYLEHQAHINRGMSASRNLGIRHARGEFIAFIDADDMWLPSKLGEHVALLDTRQEVGMVCGTTVYWHSWVNGEDKIAPTGRQQDVVVYPSDAALEVFPLGPAPGPSMSDIVLRTELVRKLNGFEEQFTGHYESRVFLSKVFLSAPVYFCSATSNKVRIHPESCVATVVREGKQLQNKLRFLEWLEQYLKTIDKVDPRVMSALRRELRPYRSPRIHYLISVLNKIRNRLYRLLARTGRLMSRKAA